MVEVSFNSISLASRAGNQRQRSHSSTIFESGVELWSAHSSCLQLNVLHLGHCFGKTQNKRMHWEGTVLLPGCRSYLFSTVGLYFPFLRLHLHTGQGRALTCDLSEVYSCVPPVGNPRLGQRIHLFQFYQTPNYQKHTYLELRSPSLKIPHRKALLTHSLTPGTLLALILSEKSVSTQNLTI